MGSKLCAFCGLNKPIDQFSAKRGRQCKTCVSDYHKSYYAKYKSKFIQRSSIRQRQNKEAVNLKNSKYRKANREKITAQIAARRKQNPDKFQQYSKNHYIKNKEKIRQTYNKKRNENIHFKMLCILRCRIRKALSGLNKSKSSVDLLGCSIEQFKKHIESLFKPGMSWDNYGYYGWHIDHIKPCARFDLSDPMEQKRCFNFKNLQPLWKDENFAKGDKWLPVQYRNQITQTPDE